MNKTVRSKNFSLAACILFSAAVLAVAPLLGMEAFSPALFFSRSQAMESQILWKLRIPRVLLAFFSGAGLAVSGMAFQALFRNPLATPYTLGVSSGASVGAVLFIFTGLMSTPFGIPGISLFAFLGALGSILFVYGITRMARGEMGTTMLLAGVAVSLFFSSVIMFLQHLSDYSDSFHILHWLMGGVETSGFKDVLTVLPFVAVGGAVVLNLTRELNLIAMGDEIALSRGVNVSRTQKLLFFATSLTVGGIVSVCGPIGFVGMMVPHICRLWIGSDHRYLTVFSLLFGGAFLVLCDLFARSVIAPAEIPVGVITALLGGPFFIWLLVFRFVEGRVG